MYAISSCTQGVRYFVACFGVKRSLDALIQLLKNFIYLIRWDFHLIHLLLEVFEDVG